MKFINSKRENAELERGLPIPSNGRVVSPCIIRLYIVPCTQIRAAMVAHYFICLILVVASDWDYSKQKWFLHLTDQPSSLS